MSPIHHSIKKVVRKSKVYVAHPIIQSLYGKEFTKKTKIAGLDAINPLRGKTEYEIARMRERGDELPMKLCEDIVRLDFKKIDESDALVALLFPGGGGMWIEIHYAWLTKKPVFILNKLGGVTHPFIKVMATKLFDHEAGLLKYLVKWNKWRNTKGAKFPD
jgi:nucleoside 2-deoxyribosyltransferase